MQRTRQSVRVVVLLLIFISISINACASTKKSLNEDETILERLTTEQKQVLQTTFEVFYKTYASVKEQLEAIGLEFKTETFDLKLNIDYVDNSLDLRVVDYANDDYLISSVHWEQLPDTSSKLYIKGLTQCIRDTLLYFIINEHQIDDNGLTIVLLRR